MPFIFRLQFVIRIFTDIEVDNLSKLCSVVIKETHRCIETILNDRFSNVSRPHDDITLLDIGCWDGKVTYLFIWESSRNTRH